jgi:hypothetical protein
MRRIVIAVSIAVFIAGARVAYTQHGGNPFIDHSDTGEVIHVLPTPASIHSPRDTQPTFAPQGFATYAPSYGSGALLNHGGHQVPNAGFYAIYWNSGVAFSAGSQGYLTLKDTIGAFASAFSGSSDYTVIGQYGVKDSIGSTLRFNDFVDTQSTQSRIADSQIRTYIAGLLASGKLGAPNPNTVYGVYFPSGMRVSMTGGQSCTSFCGYHGHFTYSSGGQSFDIKYASFPYTDCSGCRLPGTAIADMLTIVGSHEIREAVTDPDLNAWYDSSGYEADDKCAWHNLYNMTNGHFLVQPEYSNAAGGCVVP